MSYPGHSTPCLCSACARRQEKRPPLMSLCDISLSLDGKMILDDVNFTIDRGDFVAITGPNGGGKTTLLRVILSLIKPDRGFIVHYDAMGHACQNAPVPGYLPQKNSVDSKFPITVREVIASGLYEKKMDRAMRDARIEEVLGLIDLRAFAKQPIGNLSGGQLQRTLFGRAIAAKPSVLVLDEPLNYIDRHFEDRLYEIVSEIAKNTTILLVSHQMNKIAGMANRHIIVDHTLQECTHSKHYTDPECD